MSTSVFVMIIILILNLILTIAYLLWGIFLYPVLWKRGVEEGRYNRTSYFFRAVVMLLCPIIGLLFFGLGQLFYKTIFREEVDLADVIFSKERVATLSKSDEERDRNLVPLQEAMAITDKKNARGLMLNVIKGDIQKSLSVISLALNSEDSETSHYAASVLRDELNNFRGTVQRLSDDIQAADGEQLEELAGALLPYMNDVLRQRVFTGIEQENFIRTMDKACERIYEIDKTVMDIHYYEWICMRTLDMKDFELMEKWCDRLAEQYPTSLPAYTTRLKLYFTTHRKDQFFAVLQALKQSNIIIDQETLELIRIFS